MKLTEAWTESFNRLFEFHPDREEIMQKILGDDLISKGQMDKWFREADECADAARDQQLQRISEGV